MRKRFSFLLLLLILVIAFLSPAILAKDKLTIITWPTYLAPELLSDFENEYNVKVELLTYDKPTEIVNKIMGDERNYDLIINNPVVMYKLINAGKLAKLDKKLLPNSKNLDPIFMHLDHDPQNLYTLPYHYLPMGLMFNADKYNKEDISLQMYFEPPPELKGKISIYPDKRLQIGLALKYLGKSLNSRKPEDLRSVKLLLENLKKNSTEELADMERRHYQVAHEIDDRKADLGTWYYTSADLSLMGLEKNYGMKFPEEGTKLGMDLFGVLKGARNKELAHKFINYFYVPENAAKSVRYITYPVAVLGTRDNLSPEMAEKIYLPLNILAKSEFYEILSPEEEKIYDQLWNEVFCNQNYMEIK